MARVTLDMVPLDRPTPLGVKRTLFFRKVTDLSSINGSNTTPTGSRTRNRSRMAGALRANQQLEPLSSIDEEQHAPHGSAPITLDPARGIAQDFHHPSGPPRPAPPIDMTQPRPGPRAEQQYYAKPTKPQGRYAPSMPPMRARPTVSLALAVATSLINPARHASATRTIWL